MPLRKRTSAHGAALFGAILCLSNMAFAGAVCAADASSGVKKAAGTQSKHHHKATDHSPVTTAFARVNYKVERLIAPSSMHGVHGLAIGPDGLLYAANAVGSAIYKVSMTTGVVTPDSRAPHGGAGDLAFASNGALAWTVVGDDTVMVRGADGVLTTVAEDVSGVRAVNFSRDGRLYFSRIAEGDGLFEADLSGNNPPRLIVQKIGGLGAFQIDDAGHLYGPLMFRGSVVEINIATREVKEIAKGFTTPCAVRIAGDGTLVVLDNATGEIVRVDPKTGDKETLAALDVPVDNLAIAKDGMIYVSSAAMNGIVAVDPKTRATHRITWGGLAAPGMMTLIPRDKGEELLVADLWGPRFVDTETGATTLLKRAPGMIGASSIAATKDTFILANVWPKPTVQVVARDGGDVLANLTDFGAPYDVKPLADGFVVADYSVGRLTKVANDAVHTRTTLAWGFDGPVGLADAGKGVFYVSERAGGKITRVETATNDRAPVISDLNTPEGLTLAPDGRLVVAEVGAHRVLAVTPATGTAEIVADNLAIGLGGGHGPFLPTGVAVTAKGVIYVTGDVDNVLYRLTPPQAHAGGDKQTPDVRASGESHSSP